MKRLLDKTLFIRIGICLAFIALLGTVIHTQKLNTSHSTVRTQKIDTTQQVQEIQDFSTSPEQVQDTPPTSGIKKQYPKTSRSQKRNLLLLMRKALQCT